VQRCSAFRPRECRALGKSPDDARGPRLRTNSYGTNAYPRRRRRARLYDVRGDVVTAALGQGQVEGLWQLMLSISVTT
jgi:hypothetical protein